MLTSILILLLCTSLFIYSSHVGVSGVVISTDLSPSRSLSEAPSHHLVSLNASSIKRLETLPSTPQKQSCKCPPVFSVGALECDLSTCDWLLDNGYWFGSSPESNSKQLVVALCPTGYCYANSTGSSVRIPAINATSNPDPILCGNNHRTGVLCGSCVDGYAPAVNSDTFECVSCSANDEKINWLYYILSVYLPLFLLFLFIIMFNIRLMSGPANAFILYAQVVSTTFDLNADGQIPLNTIYPYVDRLLKVYRIPYNIFNLNFIANVLPPFCLHRKLNSLDIIALNYVVAVFPLIMILLVVAFYKCSCSRTVKLDCCRRFFVRRGWRLANSLIHAFAAFILLSYTRFCLISAFLVGLQPLWNEAGQDVGHKRLYFAGQFTSYDKTYTLRYGLPAYIVFATFIAIPPILLLGFPIRWFEKLVLKIEWSRNIYPFDKVNILLDTFQGCFKNNRRFFAGLYFLFRLALYMSYMLTDTWLLQYTIQQILVTLYIVLIAVLWPYKRSFINYVDIAIFANMAVLNIFSLYLIDYNELTPNVPLPVGVFIVQYILVFAPLFYMIAYVLWYLTRPYHKGMRMSIRHCYRQVVRSKCLIRRRSREDDSHGLINPDAGDTHLSRELEDSHTMEGILQRATERNTYKQNPSDYVAGSVVVISYPHEASRSSVRLDDEQNRFTTSYHNIEGVP